MRTDEEYEYDQLRQRKIKLQEDIEEYKTRIEEDQEGLEQEKRIFKNKKSFSDGMNRYRSQEEKATYDDITHYQEKIKRREDEIEDINRELNTRQRSDPVARKLRSL